MRLRATTTATDKRRCCRALLAWTDGDKLALDTVLDEAMRDPTGVPGLLFELLDLATGTGEELTPDWQAHLRATLLSYDRDYRDE